jgi:hypothetical protein
MHRAIVRWCHQKTQSGLARFSRAGWDMEQRPFALAGEREKGKKMDNETQVGRDGRQHPVWKPAERVMRGGGGLGMSSAADRGPAHTHLQLASFPRSHPHASPPAPDPFTQTRRLQPEVLCRWRRSAPPPPRSSSGGHLKASRQSAELSPTSPWHAPAPLPTPREAPLQRSLEMDQHGHLRRGSLDVAHRRAHDLLGANLDTLDPFRAFAAPYGPPAWPFSRFCDSLLLLFEKLLSQNQGLVFHILN